MTSQHGRMSTSSAHSTRFVPARFYDNSSSCISIYIHMCTRVVMTIMSQSAKLHTDFRRLLPLGRHILYEEVARYYSQNLQHMQIARHVVSARFECSRAKSPSVSVCARLSHIVTRHPSSANARELTRERTHIFLRVRVIRIRNARTRANMYTHSHVVDN